MKKAIAALPDEMFRTHHLGSGNGDVQPRQFSIDTGIQHLLLRSAQSVAARIQREHQRAASSVHRDNSGEFPVIVTTQAGPSFSFHSRALALDLCLTRVPVPPVPQSWT